jgi:Ankyrin repeats (3 copies)
MVFSALFPLLSKQHPDVAPVCLPAKPTHSLFYAMAAPSIESLAEELYAAALRDDASEFPALLRRLKSELSGPENAQSGEGDDLEPLRSLVAHRLAENGCAAIHAAASNLRLLRWIAGLPGNIGSGVINLRSLVSGMTPLMLAALENRPACARELLALGADCSAVDDNGCNAAHYAAHAGNVLMIQLFVSHLPPRLAHAALTAKTGDGETLSDLCDDQLGKEFVRKLLTELSM